MANSLIHLHLVSGKLELGSRLGPGTASLQVYLDKDYFGLTDINYILLPTRQAVNFSKSFPNLQNSHLDKTINLKLKDKTSFNFTAAVVHFYANALLIVGSKHSSIFVPMSSVKSYKLGQKSALDDNYAEEIIQQAIIAKASDIHLKPRSEHVLVQFRIDGTLRTFKKISKRQHLKIISKYKIMAGMDIAERRISQDGSTSIKFKDRMIDLRLSTAPTIEGESMVLRILDPDKGLKTLSNIGFSKCDEERIRKILNKRNGLVLVTGPTGSGKSTSLYAAMDLMRGLDLNTISIEDPVEYRIKDIKQIEVNETIGNSFAHMLRHVLRHDPDIIIIGEIRDRETAQIALQSALTGHLVVSTLHTQDAIHAISRLMEMGIEPYLLRDTLQAVLAQRLVRKLCANCNGNGSCKICGNSGFRGRAILYEWLEIDKNLRPLINHKFNLGKFKQQALANGMQDFSINARRLIDLKITTEDEVFVVD